ncbi:MAG: GNAT family N-acetyltransferase [Bacillota bacterium]|nr:GNAT family N-acetyltransferase [Bacillota bacterium]
MIRKYVDGDIDAVMQIWLNTNIRAHSFISLDYWKSNFNMVKEMMPLAEIYVHEVDNANQIDGFIGLNNDYIEGIFVKDVAQSKGIGKQLLDQVKKIRSTLKLNVYQKSERAIQFYLREEFSILSECVDDNTGEKEFTMVWKH